MRSRLSRRNPGVVEVMRREEQLRSLRGEKGALQAVVGLAEERVRELLVKKAELEEEVRARGGSSRAGEA